MAAVPTGLLLGLIGAHIQESRTPLMHEREAQALGIHCEYRLLDLDVLRLTPSDLADLLTRAEREGFAGLNITHPCKQAVVPLLTEATADSRVLGAVNTVVLAGGLRSGHNTDWWGFRESLREGLPDAPLGRIVQLGAGGAGAATAYAALDLGARDVTVLDLEPERADQLAARLDRAFPGRICASTDLPSSLAAADGLIHATPTGMKTHPGSAVSVSLLRPDLWVADVVYFPLETELLRAARALGCRTLDGSGMAVYQAVEAFRLFTGLRADVSRMKQWFSAAERVA
ncbi:MAG TPA: shikimate dehydrogenase [Vicinamibacterales bacterium]|jgi:shikimate dehydrogenase